MGKLQNKNARKNERKLRDVYLDSIAQNQSEEIVCEKIV